MKKYIIKLQFEPMFLTYNEKFEQFEWIKSKYKHLPNNAFLTEEQFNKARYTVLNNLNGFFVFTEEN